jgi:hypothetical protein
VGTEHCRAVKETLDAALQWERDSFGVSDENVCAFAKRAQVVLKELSYEMLQPGGFRVVLSSVNGF